MTVLLRLALASCSSLLLVACSGTAEDERLPVASVDSIAADSAELCRDIPDRVACRRRIEERRLAATNGTVRRSGDSLVITVEGAEPVVLVDSLDEHQVGVQYSYLGAHPRLGWHLVHVQEYEGDGWLLIHPRTKAEFPLDARPVYAPGMRRFATASWDLEAGYNANALRILSLDADSAWIEWEIEPDDWGPSSPRWASNNVLHFTKHVQLEGGGYADSTAVVTFTGEGWQLGMP